MSSLRDWIDGEEACDLPQRHSAPQRMRRKTLYANSAAQRQQTLHFSPSAQRLSWQRAPNMTTRSMTRDYCRKATTNAARAVRRPVASRLASNEKPHALYRSPLYAPKGNNATAPAAAAMAQDSQTGSQTYETSSGTNAPSLPQPSAASEHAIDHVHVGTADTIGLRPTMEDQFVVARHVTPSRKLIWLFGVLDGHGGDAASRFVAEHWPRLLFSYLDRAGGCQSRKVRLALSTSIDRVNDMLHRHFVERGIDLDTGTTLCAIVVIDGSEFYCVNVGDSRAIALQGHDYQFMGALSRDHKPANTDERRRIEALGGFITERINDVPRVVGNLAVSRALGDFPSNPFVTHEPDIVGPRPMRNLSAFVVCCDGVTDVLQNRDVAHLVGDKLRAARASGDRRESGAQRAAEHVRDSAFNAHSSDNISALVVKIPLPTPKGAAQ